VKKVTRRESLTKRNCENEEYTNAHRILERTLKKEKTTSGGRK
jgi:hypothetical protein